MSRVVDDVLSQRGESGENKRDKGREKHLYELMAEVNSNKWYEDKSQVGMPKSTAAMERKSREDVEIRECAVRDDGREWVKNVFGVVCTATVGQLQELFSFGCHTSHIR